MIKCVNEKCNNNPFDNELKMVLANYDGDFACCKDCLSKFHTQRKDFFLNLGDNDWYEKWKNN